MTKTAQELQKEQAEFWNGEGGGSWLSNFDVIDKFMATFQTLAVEAASPAEGETIVDIGCGTGGTSQELAMRVGANGHVLGVDISTVLIDAARERAAAAGIANATFEVGDAGSFPFSANTADLLFSRFGVMFFGDPYGAFANMRKALKPKGRVSFVCWQEIKKNPFFTVPLSGALTVLPKPEPAPPRAPGPFAFGEKDYVADILSQAGFRSIEFAPHERQLSRPVEVDRETTADFFMRVGPARRMLIDQPDAVVAKVRTAIADALDEYTADGQVTLKGSVWLVQATV